MAQLSIRVRMKHNVSRREIASALRDMAFELESHPFSQDPAPNFQVEGSSDREYTCFADFGSESENKDPLR